MAGQDRSRSPRSGQHELERVQPDNHAMMQNFDSVKQVFKLEKHMLAAVKAKYPGQAARALSKLEDSIITTSFSGCGLAEISIMALGPVTLGPALDWDKSCQAILGARFPDRCLFNDISEVKKMKPAYCHCHHQLCSPVVTAPKSNGFRIELAGLPCPPWSAFGKGLGTKDERYKSHKDWQSKIKKDPPDIIVFENVTRFEMRLLRNALGKEYGIKVSTLDPPQLFQVPMARPRLYFILYLKKTCRWIGPEGDDWLAGIIEAVQIPRTIPEGGKLDVSMLAETLDQADHPVATREKTNSEEKHFKLYKEAVHQGDLRHTVAWDLHQNPTERPVTERLDGSLMTLRRNCGSIYMVQEKKFLTPRQLLRMMGWPVLEEDSKALGLPHVAVPSSISGPQLCSMAGNGMFGPCSALTILAALLWVEKK